MTRPTKPARKPAAPKPVDPEKAAKAEARKLDIAGRQEVMIRFLKRFETTPKGFGTNVLAGIRIAQSSGTELATVDAALTWWAEQNQGAMLTRWVVRDAVEGYSAMIALAEARRKRQVEQEAGRQEEATLRRAVCLFPRCSDIVGPVPEAELDRAHEAHWQENHLHATVPRSMRVLL